LGQLYSEFNQNYEQVFISSVRDILIKAASEYEASELWTDRAGVGNSMQKMVDKALRKTYAECWGLQLMVIDLPDQFEASIVRTQVQKQAMLMREQEQQSTKIRAETSVIKAEYDKKVKVIMAGGQANFTLIQKKAQAHAQQNVIDTESSVLAGVKSELGLPAEGLVKYQKYGAMDEMEEASVYFGFGDASQVLVQGAGMDL